MTFFKQSLIGLAVSSLLACGGSDDATNATNLDDTPAPNNISVQGVANKGIIIGGLVTADELNSDGSVKNPAVGGAVTDGQGAYRLTLSNAYEGGPIRLSISTDNNTRMVCDAPSGCGLSGGNPDPNNNGLIDFGERFEPGSLNLKAIVSSAKANEQLDVQITPFTHMAAVRAEASGSLSDETIDAANSEVSDLLGVDILKTPPVDITDLQGFESPKAIAYAAFASGIAENADKTSGLADIQEVIDDLAGDFQNGTVSLSIAQSLLTEAEDTLDEIGYVDTSGALSELEDKIAFAANEGTDSLDPTPAPPTPDNNVELAKAFIQDVRTWGTVIDNELDNPGQNFETQIQLAADAADTMSNEELSEALSAGVQVIADAYDGVITPGQTYVGLSTGYGDFFGAVTKTEADGLLIYTITQADVETLSSENAALSMELVVPQDTVTTDTLTFGVRNILVESINARMELSAGVISATLEDETTIIHDGETTLPPITQLSFDVEGAVQQKRSPNGNLSSPVTISAGFGFTVLPYTDSMGDIVDVALQNLAIDGQVASQNHSMAIELGLNVPNAAEMMVTENPYAIYSSYSDNNGHYLYYAELSDDGKRQINYTPSSRTEYSIDDQGYVSIAYYYDYDNEGNYSDQPGYVYTYSTTYNSLEDYFSSIEYSYDNYYGYSYSYSHDFYVEGQGQYQGLIPSYFPYGSNTYPMTLVEKEDGEFNYEDELIMAGIGFELQLENLPKARFQISGTQEALDSGSATVTIAYGNRSIVISGSDSNNGAEASVTVTNSDGATLQFSTQEGVEEGTITLNGVSIATLTRQNGFTKVQYPDGSFEIF